MLSFLLGLNICGSVVYKASWPHQSFDLHDKCARCHDKLIGEDDCVLKKPCAICEGFSDSQRELLATPTYRIRKDKKAGLLVSPKDITVLSSVDDEPTFQSPSGASAHSSAQPITSPPSTMASSSSTTQATSYVTSDQFLTMSDKWAEQFARMEVLLSRGNIFSTLVSAVKPIDTQPLVSKTPFVPPATRPTGPVEKVVVKSSLAFYNRLFLVPKPNQKWRPILDLSQLNLYLRTSTFKMETPETIRLSLQKGEWVISLDISDAYFHIPIRKYLRFFLSNQTFQFTALPFGLPTAPLEFTKVVKEVKLMASLVGTSSYEAHSVALETSLARPRGSREDDTNSSVSPSRPRLVVGREQCIEGPTVTPTSTLSSAVYRRLKRRLGCTLRGLHCKRRLVNHRKLPPHKLSRTKSSPFGSKEFRASVQGPDCSFCNRQHNSGFLHKQSGRYEVRLSLCPPMEAYVLVPPQRNSPKGKTHLRSLECDSRQAFQTQSSDSNRVIPISAGIQSFVLQMGPTSGGLVCNLVQSQTSPVCITGTGPRSLGSRRPQSTMGEYGHVRFSSSLPDSPSDLQDDGSGLSQDDSHCPRVAKHALVLGPGEFVSSDSLQSPIAKRSGDSTVQRHNSQESQQSEPACLAPRVSAIQKQVFSDEVAARIESPQRGSTRAVYKSKWAIFVKWCESHEVDFRSLSVNQIANLVLHLFKERNLQPSTIEGYWTAIADMVGNDKLNISKEENLTRQFS